MKKKMMAAAVAAALFLTACGGAASGTGAKSADTSSRITQGISDVSTAAQSPSNSSSLPQSNAVGADSSFRNPQSNDSSTADSASGNSQNSASPADSSANGGIPENPPEDDSAGAAHFPAFTATSLAGDEISDKLFADAKLTVVNIWGTFCGPCIQEMPYLGELSAELAGDGVQLVGLVCDVTDLEGNVYPEQVEKAQNIVEMTGASYAHIIPSKDLSEILQNTMYVPTTYFVDAEGRILGEPLVGSRTKEDWKSVILENLASLNA